MPSGDELIHEIVNTPALMGLNNCPAVPAQMSKAVYGSVQSDSGPGTVIQPGANMQKEINTAIGFSGANSETAVWHFMMGPTVHHFVVIPWYRQQSPQGQVYTLFMAYENQYSVGQYVNGTPPAAPAGDGTKGYKTEWSLAELSTMFSELLTSNTAWQEYFGQVGATQATTITYWKYKVISLGAAIRNVQAYP
ncbi:MAG: hypothetical protein SX243_14265 [Acidobacteriota bacterium]|nr:hypothetical protein [Acidobacteriota bacterium]